MRLRRAALVAAALIVFLPVAGSASEWHQIAYSKKFAVKIFGELRDGRWCQDSMRLRVEVANKAFFHKDKFPTLMQKLFSVFHRECPVAAVAEVDVYAADTKQRISGGSASRADNWALRSLGSLADPSIPQISSNKDLWDKLGNKEIDKVKEENAWLRVNDSYDVAAVRGYLERYPDGRFANEAEARVAVLQRLASANKIDFGDYHALIIGIDDYKYLPKLQMAVKDAKAVAKILHGDYGFKVKLLIDPNRLDITDAFDEYREILTDKDNLLIYYAGHGWLDEEVDRGYWLPVDAKPKRRGGWVSNATITDTLKGLSAKHVMVVADSCYSGTLVRSADVGTRKRGGDYWKKMASKWARVAITSGGLEPVADKGGGENSPFAKAFIDTLRDNGSVMDGTTLFSKMRRPVMVAAEQTPQYSDVRGAGHDGGDFLFVRTK